MSKLSHCPECGCELSDDLFTADKMRQAFFASLRDTWFSFGPELRRRFPSSESLRKQALIAIGYCDVMTVACGSKAAAPGIAAAFQMKDNYCIATIDGAVVTVMTAKSMARRVLKKPQFREVALAVEAWVSEQTGFDASQAGMAA